MVLVEINDEEIKALDIILNKAEVKPMVGFKLISLRYNIDIALRKKMEKVKRDEKK